MQTIELDKTQSKIWQEQKELIVLFPMNPQPESIPDDCFVNEIKNATNKELHQLLKFKQGDKVQWQNPFDPLNDDLGILQQATITEVMEPKRIQDIELNIIEILGFYLGYNKYDNEAAIYRFKDWFNNKYSKPIPVECEAGCDEGYGYNFPCPHCNGDGIEKYIVYCYDEDSRIELFFKQRFDNNTDSIHSYKDKPLDIIVDPYCEISRLNGV